MNLAKLGEKLKGRPGAIAWGSYASVIVVASLVAVPMVGAGVRSVRLPTTDNKTLIARDQQIVAIDPISGSTIAVIEAPMVRNGQGSLDQGNDRAQYVSSENGENTLTVINTVTESVGPSVPLPSGLLDVGIIGDQTYVAEKATGNVSLIDPRTMSKIGPSVTVGESLSNVTTDENGALYAVNGAGQLVTLKTIDGNLTVASRRSVASGPALVVAVGAGVAVVESGNAQIKGNVHFVDGDNLTSTSFPGSDSAVVSIQPLSQRPLAILQVNERRLLLVQATGVVTIQLEGKTAAPVVSLNGRTYVKNLSNRRVEVYDATGKRGQDIDVVGDGDDFDLTVDDNRLWISDPGSDSLVVVELDGRVSQQRIAVAGAASGSGADSVISPTPTVQPTLPPLPTDPGPTVPTTAPATTRPSSAATRPTSPQAPTSIRSVTTRPRPVTTSTIAAVVTSTVPANTVPASQVPASQVPASTVPAGPIGANSSLATTSTAVTTSIENPVASSTTVSETVPVTTRPDPTPTTSNPITTPGTTLDPTQGPPIAPNTSLTPANPSTTTGRSSTTQPPVTQPPVTQPPVTRPPVTQGPQPTPTNPPVSRPPATQPPGTQPPATQPPTVTVMPPVTLGPPASVPPTTQPLVTQPPRTQPPRTQPPATQPPVTQPPATTPPPATPPLTTRPPATQPPATQPPTTIPPGTQPPLTTRPPATQPPATQPPTTIPPATLPPATVPLTTVPPTTQVPIAPPTAVAGLAAEQSGLDVFVSWTFNELVPTQYRVTWDGGSTVTGAQSISISGFASVNFNISVEALTSGGAGPRSTVSYFAPAPPTTIPPTTIAPTTTIPPTTEVPTTVPATTIAPTTIPPTTRIQYPRDRCGEELIPPRRPTPTNVQCP